MSTKKITIYDTDRELTYDLEVSLEDAERAENDAQFAANLLLQMNTISNDINANANNETEILEDRGVEQRDAREDTGLYRWTTIMVLLLLDTYINNERKLESGKYSQKKFWELIADQMKCQIPSITGPQCAAKMRSLKKTYKNIKDHNSKSGNDRRSWLFYEKMDNIFREKAWISPLAVASSSGVSTLTGQSSESVSSGSSSSQSTKETVTTLFKRRLRQKREEEEARAQRHKERLEMDEKILALLSKLVDKM